MKLKSIFIVTIILSFCSLVYEFLLMSTLSTIFGDSIFYHSITIGLYIFFLGIGAFLARNFQSNSSNNLIKIEIILSLIGGLSIVFIFLMAATSSIIKYNLLIEAQNLEFSDDIYLDIMKLENHKIHGIFKLFFASVIPTYVVSFLFIIVIGVLSGAEIPLLITIAREGKIKDSVPQVLFFDYVGAFFAAIIFPFLLYPYLGLFRTAFITALLNLVAGIYLTKKQNVKKPVYILLSIILLILFLFMYIFENKIENYIDKMMYYSGEGTRVEASFYTEYQKVVLTSNMNKNGYGRLVLYLNGAVQFSYSEGDRLYHNLIVHPSMALAKDPKDILILGGGDGLPLQQVLQYTSLNSVTMVDIDGKLVAFSKENQLIANYNNFSLSNPNFNLIIDDAFKFVKKDSKKYDIIIKDFPEGYNEALSKSFSLQFFKDVKRILKSNGILVVHYDLYGFKSYWTIVKTLREVGYNVLPLKLYFNNKNPSDGLIYASLSPLNFSNLDKNEHVKELIKNNQFPNNEILQSYIEEDYLNNMTSNLSINTIYKPIFLHYVRTEFPFIPPYGFY